jgi:hypothetical protein
MSDEAKVIHLSSKRRLRYTTDPVGTLQEALACAHDNEIRAVAVAMINAGGEEFYLISEGATDPALLGAIEIVKDIVLDDLRAEE